MGAECACSDNQGGEDENISDHCREIPFQVLDVTDDEATRLWATSAAKQAEFPLVFIAGEAVGGLHELTQLDINRQLSEKVFGKS